MYTNLKTNLNFKNSFWQITKLTWCSFLGIKGSENEVNKQDFLELIKGDINIIKIHECEAVFIKDSAIKYTLE